MVEELREEPPIPVLELLILRFKIARDPFERQHVVSDILSPVEVVGT